MCSKRYSFGLLNGNIYTEFRERGSYKWKKTKTKSLKMSVSLDRSDTAREAPSDNFIL